MALLKNKKILNFEPFVYKIQNVKNIVLINVFSVLYCKIHRFGANTRAETRPTLRFLTVQIESYNFQKIHEILARGGGDGWV